MDVAAQMSLGNDFRQHLQAQCPTDHAGFQVPLRVKDARILVGIFVHDMGIAAKQLMELVHRISGLGKGFFILFAVFNVARGQIIMTRLAQSINKSFSDLNGRGACLILKGL